MGIVVARFSTDNFLLAVSADGINFTSDITITGATAVSSGATSSFFYNGAGPFNAALFVHSIDLTNFGLSSGASIAAVRITGNTQLDLIRAAGFGDPGVPTIPEPASLFLMGVGLAGLLVVQNSRMADKL